MGRDRLDRIKEKAPESMLTGFLQIDGYSCTKVREAMATLMENHLRAYSIQELVSETGISRASLYRNLPTLPRPPPPWTYISAARRFLRVKTAVTVTASAKSAKHVEEFVHAKHAHPRLRRIGNLKTDHEWLGLCSNCDRP